MYGESTRMRITIHSLQLQHSTAAPVPAPLVLRLQVLVLLKLAVYGTQTVHSLFVRLILRPIVLQLAAPGRLLQRTETPTQKRKPIAMALRRMPMLCGSTLTWLAASATAEALGPVQ